MNLTELAVGYMIMALGEILPRFITKDENKRGLLKFIFASISLVVFISLWIRSCK